MTQLSRLEWVVLNQKVKGREHFIFNASDYSKPLEAITKRDKAISDIQNKFKKPIPRWKLPKESRSFNQVQEYLSDNVVDSYIGFSKSGRINKKARTEEDSNLNPPQ